MWKDKPCLLTKAGKDGYSLGRKTSFTGRVRPHVFALEQVLGRPVKTGYYACHRCGVRNCIEPEHLYEGTPTDNINDAYKAGRGSNSWGANNANKTHCPKGHEYTSENTTYEGRLGQYRRCKICRRSRRRIHA